MSAKRENESGLRAFGAFAGETPAPGKSLLSSKGDSVTALRLQKLCC